MRGRGLVVFVAGILACALAAPAGAEPTLAGRSSGDVITGPRLAGESVFYGEMGSKRTVLRLATPGTKARKLITLNPPPSPPDPDEESPGDFVSFSDEIAASAQRLAYKVVVVSGNGRYQVGNSRLLLYGGGTGLVDDFSRLEDCGHSDIYSPAAAALDIDGPRVASTNCTGNVVIRDYTGPTPTEKSVSAGSGLAIGTARMAGRYLAYNAYPIGPTGTTPTVTVVHDWVADTKVYEIPRVTNYDIQDDGTLAVATGEVDDLDCSKGKLAWYSVAQPTEHVLPVKPCTSEVRIAGNRIAANAAGENGTDRVFALVGLDGTRTDVARLGTGMRRGTIDYDGTRVAYTLGNCLGGADLLTESASAPALRDEPVACPVGGLPKKASLGPKDKAAHVNVKCPRGCRGRIEITAQIGGKTRRIGSLTSTIAPEDRCLAKVHRVPISSSARALLRERGSLLARVTVATSDRNGAPRVTTRALRLRAASSNSKTPKDCFV
jgi:hypothetical protein